MSKILQALNAARSESKRFSRYYRLFGSLSPVEAGRKAESIAMDLYPKQKQTLPTMLSHAGIEDIPNSPMAPPLHLATTYTRPADGIYKDGDFIYSRNDNPTRLLLEKTVFQLETSNLMAESDEVELPSTFAFASGMQAVAGIILAHGTPLTVVLPLDVYHGVPTVLAKVFARHGISVVRSDMNNPKKILEVLETIDQGNEVIVWMESPSNPKCDVCDIMAICAALRNVNSHEITTVVDATMASPVVTRPLELGADISMHSGTKYMAGHSDALLGLVTASPLTTRGQVLKDSLRDVQTLAGGVASPWDSWLTLRGLKTLHVRVEQQARSAQALAEFLEGQEEVSHVHYPGLPVHPQHEVAKSQMANFGGVFSVEFETEAMAVAFAAGLRIVQRATSLGGTETLIEHRASIEPPERRVSPPGLLRVSVGLEDTKQLLQDIKVALSIAKEVTTE